MTKRYFSDGDVIFLDGDPGETTFTVLEGKVEMSKAGEKGRVPLSLMGPGERFGGVYQAGGNMRASTARAVGNVTLDEALNVEPGLSAAPSSMPTQKQGFFESLLGFLFGGSKASGSGTGKTGGDQARNKAGGGFFSGAAHTPRAERIEIRVAKISSQLNGNGDGAIKIDYTRQVVAALNKQKGVRVKTLNREIPSPGDSISLLEEAEAIGREWIVDAKADLLIWGDVPPPGTTLRLRFVSGKPVDENRPGGFDISTTFEIPVGFGPEMSPLLISACLAATGPSTEGKNIGLHKIISDSLYAATPVAANLPPDVISRERATILFCFANAIAVSASHRNSAELYNNAVEAYQAALKHQPREDHPFEWAVNSKNLGEVLLALAEINNDTEMLESAADALSETLKVISRLDAPRLWASAQNSLGLALYRLDLRAGDTEVLKHSLASFQEALKVYTRADSPLLWAEVMSNFAQAAQVLGKQLRNPEVLKKAVSACQSVLEVRKKENAPMLWAATQNNLGSAMFMLGKMSKDQAHLEGAAEAFNQARDFYRSCGAEKLAAITEKNLSHAEKLLKKHAPKGVPRMRWEKDDADSKKQPPSGKTAKD
ncbi:MAG: cyclic nucleotide-binding domain-containing protein [Rhodospirillales bacterium]